MQKKSIDTLNRFAWAYGCLEKAVQDRIVALCGPFCAACATPCCRPNICRDSLESSFLRQVMILHPPLISWHATFGWHTPHGCGLVAGRPPVCYEFSCNMITKAQSTAAHRYALNALFMLMTYVGRHALGGRHVVVLENLERLNFHRLERQMAVARTALHHLDLFWADAQKHPLPLATFKAIRRPGSAFKIEAVAQGFFC